MGKYLSQQSNFDKWPVIRVSDDQSQCINGWQNIGEFLSKQAQAKSVESVRTQPQVQSARSVIVFECYHGVLDDELLPALKAFLPGNYFLSSDCFLKEEQLESLVKPDVTDDEVFGFMTRLCMNDFFDHAKLDQAKESISNATGTVVVYGCGASLLCPQPDILVYVDMARWEIQQRLRQNRVSNLGASNREQRASLKYKRAFFVDWRVCDRLKKQLLKRWDYVLDTNVEGSPKLVAGEALQAGFRQAVSRPFRVVPFFDPGPWGGQWMKEVCDLDKSVDNFAWCFDCVPEENSLFFQFACGTIIETPAINLVFAEPQKLLGRAVQARFGDEFPIRFDFLDTMDGGNLSLQVHPTTEYIQEKFGMHYTQDESYYLLDAGSDACVYLGLKTGIKPEEMIDNLNDAQSGGPSFDAERFVQKWPVKKHDHVLIPAGTVHCSGANSMVLEISSTPYIFTFKLWDWDRMGLDGKPRPINIEHGREVIDFTRTTEWVKDELVNVIQELSRGDGWREEKTGLHEREFIETRRHWFTQKVTHHTSGGVNVLNLVEGSEVIVESPTEAFAPFIVHYAETFIVPEAVKVYTIRPYGAGLGQECATVKAFVRTSA